MQWKSISDWTRLSTDWWSTCNSWLPEGREGTDQLPERLWSLRAKWKLAACVYVCAHVYVRDCTGHSGLISDPRPAAAWTRCLSSAAGSIHSVCVCTVKQSEVGLWPQEPIHAVTGGSVCLCPASRGIHFLHMYLLHASRPSLWSLREGNRMMPTVLFAFVLRVSVRGVLCDQHMYVCAVCVFACVWAGSTCHWFEWGLWSCGSLAPTEVLDLVTS